MFTSTIAEANVKGMLDIQQLGSKHTYLKRYLYYNYLNLTRRFKQRQERISTPTQHFRTIDEDEYTLKSYKVEKLMDLTHDQAD